MGMVAGGRGASCCRQPMGRRSRFNPCMPGRLGVGPLACGLFIVGFFFLQQSEQGRVERAATGSMQQPGGIGKLVAMEWGTMGQPWGI